MFETEQKKIHLGPACISGDTYVTFDGHSRQIVIPSGIKRVCNRAFYRNAYIETVIIGEDCELVDDEAFSCCPNLKSVVFMNKSLLTIGSMAFKDCPNLESVVLNRNIEAIGACAFQNTGIDSFALPPLVEHVTPYCFADCRNLTNFYGHTNLKMIDAFSFYNCQKLCHLEGLTKLTSVNYLAFVGIPKQIKVNYGEWVRV